MPPDLAPQVAATLACGHFLCHVFHLDYVLKRGAHARAFKAGMLRMLDDSGAEYPAEHNVGHLYEAKPALAAFYQELDPLGLFNPGIGGTPRPSAAMARRSAWDGDAEAVRRLLADLADRRLGEVRALDGRGEVA